MSNTRLPSLALLMAAISSPVFALNTEPAPAPTSKTTLGIEVAEATGGALSDSAIKRMNHYAAQALAALTGFGNTDISQNDAITTMREKISRLMDAGARSGLSDTQTATYFQAYVEANGLGSVPAFFLGSNGQLDAEALFASVVSFYASATPETIDLAAVDRSDLEAIGSVAQSLNPVAPEATQSLVLTVTEEPAFVETGPQLPEIPANASAAEVAILERIKLRGQDWVIEIQEGDSLYQISEALYGDRQQFLKIYEANAGVLRTPSMILVGQELVLPQG